MAVMTIQVVPLATIKDHRSKVLYVTNGYDDGWSKKVERAVRQSELGTIGEIVEEMASLCCLNASGFVKDVETEQAKERWASICRFQKNETRRKPVLGRRKDWFGLEFCRKNDWRWERQSSSLIGWY